MDKIANNGTKIGEWIGEGITKGLETFKAGDRQVKGVPLNLQIFTDADPEALAKGLGSPVRDEAYYKQEQETGDPLPPDHILFRKNRIDQSKIEKLISGIDETLKEKEDVIKEDKEKMKKLFKGDIDYPEAMDRNEYIQLAEFQKEEIRKLTRERDLWKYVTELFFDKLRDAPFNPIKDK